MRRARQRGTAIVVMMIVLVALGTIAGLTVISVQGGSATTNSQRFNSMALYAAESGAAAAMQWLKGKVSPPNRFTSLFDGTVPGKIEYLPTAAEIHGNGILPGAPGNLLSADQQGWYEVTIHNNRSDLQYGAGADDDGVLLILVTGHGPNGAIKKLEWEVAAAGPGLPLTLLGWRDTF